MDKSHIVLTNSSTKLGRSGQTTRISRFGFSLLGSCWRYFSTFFFSLHPVRFMYEQRYILISDDRWDRWRVSFTNLYSLFRETYRRFIVCIRINCVGYCWPVDFVNENRRYQIRAFIVSCWLVEKNGLTNKQTFFINSHNRSFINTRFSLIFNCGI